MLRRVWKLGSAVAAVAVVLAAGLGSGLAASGPAAPTLPPSGGVIQPRGDISAEAAPGYRVPLRADDTDAHTTVEAPVETARPGVKGATFVVNYSGFTPEARAAFQRAVDIWAAQISSPVEIHVNASWSPLESGVLGQAGPALVYRDWGNAPVANTWYPIATANRIAGRDLVPGQPDIGAEFSSTFTNWYFGLDGRPPTGQYDFVSVVLHELGHGLGFLGSMRQSGTVGVYGSSGFPLIFDRYALNGAGVPLLTLPSETPLLLTELVGGNLYFDGPNAVAAAGGTRPRLYAPNPFESGSSYSHLDEATYGAGNLNSLMTPKIGRAEAIHDPGPITRGIFTDAGWSFSTPGNTPTPTPTPDGIPSQNVYLPFTTRGRVE